MNSLRRLVHGLRVFDHKASQLTGLSGAQLFVLGKLANKGAANINELAERTATHQSTVSVVAQKLAARGLIARSHPRDDARKVQLSITAAGRRILIKAPGTAQDELIAALGRLKSVDRRHLARALNAWVEFAGLKFIHPALFFQDAVKGNANARKGN